MRHLASVGLAVLLSACGGSIESEHPLFGAGADGFKPGMWAAVSIEEPCELPKDAAIFNWPDCAAPILIESGTAAYFTPAHVRVAFIVADGTPRIIQSDKDVFGGIMDQPDKAVARTPDHRFYASFYPDSSPPFTAGRIQFLLCPSQEADAVEEHPSKSRKRLADTQNSAIPGMRRVVIDDKSHCFADTPETVREMARRATPGDATMRLVWIASYP